MSTRILLAIPKEKKWNLPVGNCWKLFGAPVVEHIFLRFGTTMTPEMNTMMAKLAYKQPL